MTQQLEKASEYARALADRYLSARQKRAILEPFRQQEMADLFADSYGGHAYKGLQTTLVLDLLREIWAIVLDDDERVPSLQNIWRLVQNPQLRGALRQHATRPRNVEGSFAGEWSEEERAKELAAWKEDRSRKDGEAFDEAFSEIEAVLPRLLTSTVAGKIKTARDKVIAHYEMKSTDKGRKLFPLKDVGLTWNEVTSFLDDIAAPTWNLVLVTTWGSYDVEGFDEMHRLYAADFWARIQGKPPVESLK